MQRFFLPELLFKNDYLIINDERIAFQVFKVLRMKPGHFFHVFDGENEYLTQIESLTKRKVVTKKVKVIKNEAEPSLKISLYQAIPKKPALFELVIQKATEIGVHQIFPLITERTENRRLSKFERLKLIAIEAAEQSGRLNIPIIRHPVNFEEVVPDFSNGFIAYEYEGSSFMVDYASILSTSKEAQLIIGPEGGLTEAEVSLAKENSIKPFSLGKRILRTETAAISSLSLMLLSQ